MSTFMIWVIFPIILGFILVLLRGRRNLVAIVGTLVAMILAIAALRLPLDGVVVFGQWRTVVKDQVSLYSLQFILSGKDRSMLVILYSMTAFILGGSIPARVQRRFLPFGLIIIALIVAALAINPVIYGVFLFQLVVLLNVLILSPPGQLVSKGVLRYLIFQLLGMTFILLGGWFLSDSDLINDPAGVIRAVLVLGIGFVFLFAVFPMYAWVTMIAEDDHPYAAMFVLSMTFGAYTLFFLDFLDYYDWLLSTIDFYGIIRFMGILMVGTGGIWAAFQRNLGRLFGHAVVFEVGNSLLAIGIQNSELYYAMLVPRLISLAVWALGLSVLKPQTKDLGFKSVHGMAWRYPLASAAVLFAHFSITGLPLLAGFPLLLTLWKQLALVNTSQVIWSFLGSIGLMMGCFRSLAVLVMSPKQVPLVSEEDVPQRTYLIIGVVSIFVFGFFPHLLYPLFIDLVSTLTILTP